MATVTYDHVTKRFGDFVAVNDLNLAVRDSEFLVLVGPSGCGKTTALRMLAGLEEQTTGDIRIGERVVNDVPPKDRDIAMVFQNYALYPHMSVYDNIAFGLKLRGMPKQEIERPGRRRRGFLKDTAQRKGRRGSRSRRHPRDAASGHQRYGDGTAGWTAPDRREGRGRRVPRERAAASAHGRHYELHRSGRHADADQAWADIARGAESQEAPRLR